MTNSDDKVALEATEPRAPIEAAEATESLEPTEAHERDEDPATSKPAADEPSLVATRPYPQAVEAPDPAAADEPGVGRDDGTDAAAPRLSDVGTTFADWARGRREAARSTLRSHRAAALVIVLGCVGGVLACVLMGIRASQVPGDALVRSDAQARLGAPEHSPSAYARDERLVLQDVEIASKRRGATRDDAIDVSLIATFSNGAMESRTDATLTYTREGDSWICIAATSENASHRALAGVDTQRVTDALDTLLEAADDPDDQRESLVSLYRDASVELGDESFDEESQTSEVRLKLSSSGTFVSYDCTLDARFRFVPASGAWELSSAKVDGRAKDLGFRPLIGTWQGSFTHQESSSSKCLAAREAGLTITIERATLGEEGGALVEGTLTGVAHLHGDLAQDAGETEGDLRLESVPFTGSLATHESEEGLMALLGGGGTQPAAGIVFECTTQDVAGGRVSLTLELGSSSAPDTATATLVSTHSYQDTFLLVVPYEREARFADSFILEKQG